MGNVVDYSFYKTKIPSANGDRRGIGFFLKTGNGLKYLIRLYIEVGKNYLYYVFLIKNRIILSYG